MRGRPAARTLLVAALAVGLVLPGTGLSPSSAAVHSGVAHAKVTAGPKVPKCKVADDLTRFRKLKHWDRSLLDHQRRLSKKYVPTDLVPVSRAGLSGGGKVRKIVVKDLGAMAKAAKKAGAPLGVRSAYRSYSSQSATFSQWTSKLGRAAALKAAARPGHSEHQLGTTLDLKVAGSSGSFPGFVGTKQAKWLKKNAWKYGFVVSYPEGKTAKTCYKFEPWHVRYVGKDMAKAVKKSKLTLREYLWREFEAKK